MRRTALATVVTLIAIGLMPTASAQTLTVTVDCSRGQTITHALRQGDSRKPLVVVVRGTCNEHVSISRDDVTLRGQPGTEATVNGPDSGTDTIVILKDTVNIEDLTVTGGFNGIRLQGPFLRGGQERPRYGTRPTTAFSCVPATCDREQHGRECRWLGLGAGARSLGPDLQQQPLPVQSLRRHLRAEQLDLDRQRWHGQRQRRARHQRGLRFRRHDQQRGDLQQRHGNHGVHFPRHCRRWQQRPRQSGARRGGAGWCGARRQWHHRSSTTDRSACLAISARRS